MPNTTVRKPTSLMKRLEEVEHKHRDDYFTRPRDASCDEATGKDHSRPAERPRTPQSPSRNDRPFPSSARSTEATVDLYPETPRNELHPLSALVARLGAEAVRPRPSYGLEIGAIATALASLVALLVIAVVHLDPRWDPSVLITTIPGLAAQAVPGALALLAAYLLGRRHGAASARNKEAC